MIIKQGFRMLGMCATTEAMCINPKSMGLNWWLKDVSTEMCPDVRICSAAAWQAVYLHQVMNGLHDGGLPK